MKEFVYHVSEEEKIPLVINKILSSPEDQFVIFSKDKKQIMNLFEYCKKYHIPYAHLYSENANLAFKNYNEKKSKVFFISDDLLEKKTFFIPSTNQIIHFDIPSHPLIYQKRNQLIKNSHPIRLIHIYCIPNEIQDLKAIEVYFEKKISLGNVLQKDLKLPPIESIARKSTKKSITKKVSKRQPQTIHPKETPKQEVQESLWSKIKSWFKKLWNKPKKDL
jgi:superfamily II DNA/RNA helicase